MPTFVPTKIGTLALLSRAERIGNWQPGVAYTPTKIIVMQKASNNNSRKKAGSKTSGEPRPVSEILCEIFAGESTLARNYRERLFKDLFPDTFTCVDLKVITRQPSHMGGGEMVTGTLVCNGEDSFTFIEAPEKKKTAPTRRNPIVFEGGTVNVHRLPDGSYRLEFVRPRFYPSFTFRDFCIAASIELLTVASLLGGSEPQEEKA